MKFFCDSVTDNVEAIVIKEDNNIVYPLGGIYSKKILPQMEKMIKEKDYKLLNLIDKIKVKINLLYSANFNKIIRNNINY